MRDNPEFLYQLMVAPNVFKDVYAPNPRGKWENLRKAVIAKYGRICGRCGRKNLSGRHLHIDHVYSRAAHPEHTWDLQNLQVLCDRCNSSKHDKSFDYRLVSEARSFLDGHPGEPGIDWRPKFPWEKKYKRKTSHNSPYRGGKFGAASDVRIIDPKTGAVKAIYLVDRKKARW